MRSRERDGVLATIFCASYIVKAYFSPFLGILLIDTKRAHTLCARACDRDAFTCLPLYAGLHDVRDSSKCHDAMVGPLMTSEMIPRGLSWCHMGGGGNTTLILIVRLTAMFVTNWDKNWYAGDQNFATVLWTAWTQNWVSHKIGYYINLA